VEATGGMAAELAGDFTVAGDELAQALLDIVRRSSAPEDLRSTAAISLGPALESADTDDFEDGSVPISERMFDTIRRSLREAFGEAAVPVQVRRRILEASVRAPQPWHHEAIDTAFRREDRAWRLTAVFCMCHVRGFDAQILEALDSSDPEIHAEAVEAAGVWGVRAAWPHVAALVAAESTSKPLFLAAITAVGTIRPREAPEVLGHLLDSDDEDIVDAVREVMVMAEDPWDEDEDEDERE